MKKISRIKNLDICIEAPSAKAYTLRALILSSLASGESIIHKPLLGEDQLNLMESLKRLGVEIKKIDNTLYVTGCSGKYMPKTDEINVGESGVAINFLASTVCLCEKEIIITGADGLLVRPVSDVVNGLRQLGCEIEYLNKEGFPPIKVKSNKIVGGRAKMSGVKTSQYFSSIVIASPFAQSNVELDCIDFMSERPYFDITVQMMSDFGATVNNIEYKKISVPCNQDYHATELVVEGDYSSASFFFLAAAICGSRVTVSGLKKNSKQGDKKVIDLLCRMGCKITQNDNEVCVEGNNLIPIEENMADVPDLVPPIAIAAAFADGTSKLTGVGHLRYKECNRLEAIVEELKKMGGNAFYDDDSLVIEGGKQLSGAEIDSHNDHRIAMSFAVAGLVIDGQIINGENCVAKSFPDFWERFNIFY
jgi:3-phosphoshikimate 1-carboxyvinyltransferase